jgi:hypothetical protein
VREPVARDERAPRDDVREIELLLAEQVPAHPRVNAVGSDQHVAAGAMAGLELHRDAAGLLGEPQCALAEPDDATRERVAEHPE